MTDDLCFRPARELAGLVRRRELSARELLSAHLDRIESLNPRLNAIVSLDSERAADAARHADELIAADAPTGPLHGLPVAFKDTHATAGLRTTYGSPLFAEHIPDDDDEIVRRVHAAGAIRLGKTNVPEFAAGSHTFNDVFGVTRNPYDTGRSAGGSSGGAAAALAAGLQPVADGSDMGGSLRNPASFCNVVGLRPTPGLVPDPASTVGYSPLAVAGPMARTVSDVALLLSVIAGYHRDDPLSWSQPGGPVEPVPATLRGLRVAWAPDLGGRVAVEPDVRAVLESALKEFEAEGAVVEPGCPDLDGADHAFRTLRAAEFDALWGRRLADRPAQFKPDLARNIRAGRSLGGADVIAAFAELARLQRAAHAFFDRFDVLAAPVSQVAPFDADLAWPTHVDGSSQDTYLDWMASAYLISTLGAPAISVPAGFTPGGLPVGIQLVTRARTESTLLSIAAAFEAATRHGLRTPPTPEHPR